MKESIAAFLLVALAVNLLEGKLQIDVAERLAKAICGIVQKSVQSKTVITNNDLQQTLQPPGNGDCYIWRWLKCDFNARPQPCSEWTKIPCDEAGPGGDNSTVTKPYCEVYQCGWTLDELFENWGYNPKLMNESPLNKRPNNATIVTGSTLDFPTFSKP